MNDSIYNERLEKLFVRYPSVQNTGFGDAYKPGLRHMNDFAALMGHPERSFRTVHVAGTNGKGSVANMLAAALSATGLRVGLYTSPHILDFRERMRVVDGAAGTGAELISREDVWEFITTHEKDFDELDLSFFEITTGMAFWWFSKQKVDVAVIEVGLGGRLDSTNIITPEISIVTSIGLDHCAMLGSTRAEIAEEKAGIFKPGVPAVAGGWDSETGPVFERVAAAAGTPLHYADRDTRDLSGIISRMDLQGEYQSQNLRTVLVSLDILGVKTDAKVLDAVTHTAKLMDFHGRWEMVSRNPDMICDIGHNPPALTQNFRQLRSYLMNGRYSGLIIVYGVMADKDLDGILPLMPGEATYICVAPDTARAMKVEVLYEKCRSHFAEKCGAAGTEVSGKAGPDCGAAEPLKEKAHIGGTKGETADACARVLKAESVAKGLEMARKMAESQANTLIYVGGSTFVVSEAVSYLNKL